MRERHLIFNVRRVLATHTVLLEMVQSAVAEADAHGWDDGYKGQLTPEFARLVVEVVFGELFRSSGRDAGLNMTLLGSGGGNILQKVRRLMRSVGEEEKRCGSGAKGVLWSAVSHREPYLECFVEQRYTEHERVALTLGHIEGDACRFAVAAKGRKVVLKLGLNPADYTDEQLGQMADKTLGHEYGRGKGVVALENRVAELQEQIASTDADDPTRATAEEELQQIQYQLQESLAKKSENSRASGRHIRKGSTRLMAAVGVLRQNLEKHKKHAVLEWQDQATFEHKWMLVAPMASRSKGAQGTTSPPVLTHFQLPKLLLVGWYFTPPRVSQAVRGQGKGRKWYDLRKWSVEGSLKMCRWATEEEIKCYDDGLASKPPVIVRTRHILTVHG